MPALPRPEDIPPDYDHVCGLCGFPAAYSEEAKQWQHADAADAAFCSTVFRGGRACA